MWKWSLILGMLFFAALPARANDIYLAPSGSGNGSSCSSPRSYTFFNSRSNWGSGSSQIGPGTTVHLCAGTYNNPLGFNGSGTSSARITLHFETGAVMAAPVWSWISGAISTNGYSHIVIDGGTNGTIENTANGTDMANQAETDAIQLGPNSGSSTDVEVKDLTCANMYVQIQNAVFPSGLENTHLNCVYEGGNGASISIHDNVMHDVAWAIFFAGGGCAGGCNIYNNDIYNFDHGFIVGLDGCSSCSASNVSFHDNHVHDPANWDDPADNNHHDGVHLYDNAGSGTMSINGVAIYNNLFDGSWGAHFTAQVFCTPAPGIIENVSIYNNIFSMTHPLVGGNGLVTCDITSGATLSFYNNTLIGGVAENGNQFGCFKTAHDNVEFRNNVFVSCPVPVSEYNTGETLPTPLNWDHNVYEQPTYWGWGQAIYRTLAAFEAACNCDRTGSLASSGAYASTTGVPTSGSPALNAGVNLCSVLSCSGGMSSLADDTSAGDTQKPVARPTGTLPWDAGAYQVSNVNRPVAPSGLTATVE
jgi:hypothetical protein